MGDVVKGWLDSIFTFESFNLFDDFLKGIVSIINTSLGGVMNNVIQPLGISFLLLWFLIDFMDTMSMQEFSSERIFKKFIFLAIGYLLIANVEIFVKTIPEIITQLNVDVNKQASGDMALASNIGTIWKAKYDSIEIGFNVDWIADILTSLICSVVILIAWLITQFCGFLIWISKAGAMLEMSIRGVFLPLGCSDISQGLNGACSRYLRKYIAAGFQLTVVTITAKACMAIGNKMTGLILNINGIDFTTAGKSMIDKIGYFDITLASISILLIYVLGVIMCSRAANIANDVFGA